MTGWSDLAAELDAWGETDATVEFWLRDDDAGAGAAVPAPTLQELGAPAQSLRSNDAQHVRDQVAFLLRGWIHICREGSHTNDKTCARYLQLMQENGMLRGDENADRFFRITAELLDKYGYTDGCLGGEAKRHGLDGSGARACGPPAHPAA